MLPMHHLKNSPPHGGKRLPHPGVIIAVCLAVATLAVEHLHFRGKVHGLAEIAESQAARIAFLEAQLKTQSQLSSKVEQGVQASVTVKKVQEQVIKSESGLKDLGTQLGTLKDVDSSTFERIKQLQSELKVLTARVASVEGTGASTNSSFAAINARLATAGSGLEKLDKELQSHTSVLKMLTQQLETHQNSTISAIQSQHAAVAEALEKHKELQSTVQALAQQQQQQAQVQHGTLGSTSIKLGQQVAAAPDVKNATSTSTSINAPSGASNTTAAAGEGVGADAADGNREAVVDAKAAGASGGKAGNDVTEADIIAELEDGNDGGDDDDDGFAKDTHGLDLADDGGNAQADAAAGTAGSAKTAATATGAGAATASNVTFTHQHEQFNALHKLHGSAGHTDVHKDAAAAAAAAKSAAAAKDASGAVAVDNLQQGTAHASSDVGAAGDGAAAGGEHKKSADALDALNLHLAATVTGGKVGDKAKAATAVGSGGAITVSTTEYAADGAAAAAGGSGSGTKAATDTAALDALHMHLAAATGKEKQQQQAAAAGTGAGAGLGVGVQVAAGHALAGHNVAAAGATDHHEHHEMLHTGAHLVDEEDEDNV